jgi:hypothetical protein
MVAVKFSDTSLGPALATTQEPEIIIAQTWIGQNRNTFQGLDRDPYIDRGT